MDDHKNRSQINFKYFLIKLISVSFAIPIVVILLFNLIFAESLDMLNKVLNFDKRNTKSEFKQKLRKEISKVLGKENMINEKDKVLLYKFYLKI